MSVTTDYYQSIPEYDTNGNAAYGNNTSSITVPSTLGNYADLIVAAGSLAVTPTNPQSSGTVTVTWNDENQGDAAVTSAFNDSVLVQRVNPDNSLTYITSGDVSGDPSLAIGAISAPQQFLFTLPDGPAGTGNFQVTVTTDSGKTVKEYDSNGSPAYSNNSAGITTDLDTRELSRIGGHGDIRIRGACGHQYPGFLDGHQRQPDRVGDGKLDRPGLHFR